MKKKILLILMFMTMFIVGNRDVSALKCEVGEDGCTVQAIKDEVESETKQLACVYEVELRKDRKYYSYIYYNIVDDKFYANSTFKDKSVLLQDDANAYLLGDAYNQLYFNNSCPAYAYLDEIGVKGEMCFDNNNVDCVNNGKNLDWGTSFNGTLNSSPRYDNAKNIGIDTDNTCRYQNNYGDYIEYNRENNTMYLFVVEDGKTYFVDSTYNVYKESNSPLSTSYNFSNFISSSNVCPSDIYMFKKVDSFNYIEYYRFFDSTDSQEYQDSIGEKGFGLSEFYCTSCNGSGVVIEDPAEGCAIISDDLRKIINDVMKIIRIAIPLLLIGLITFDFATAVFAGDDKAVNKAKSNAIKRIIIAVVIFFVPTLINLVFDVANEVWANANYEICGLDE